MDQEQMIRRICDLDIIAASLQEKLAYTLSSFEDLKVKSVNKDELRLNIDDLSSKIPQNSMLLRNALSEFSDRMKALEDKLAKLGDHIDVIYRKLEPVPALKDKLESHIEMISGKQNSFERRLSDQIHVQELIQNELKNLHESNKILKDQNVSIKSTLNLHESKLNQSFDNDKSVAYEIHKMKEDMDKKFNDRIYKFEFLNSCIDQLNKDLKKSILSLEEKFKYDLSNIPQPEIPPQVDVKSVLIDMVKPYDERINSIHLDIENAILSSKNSDMYTKVLDKKLENIYLLLKKHEIIKS